MARGYSVDVSGNEVYVSGRETNNQDNAVATLWKNGVAQRLSDGTEYSVAESVCVSGNNVYVAVKDGFLWGNANLWYNGTKQNLGGNASLTDYTSVNSVFVVK